jgi:hypothetical protein
MNLSETITLMRKTAKLAKAPYAWPGGYPVYFLADDGATLCGPCVADRSNPCHVNGQADGWRIEAPFIHWEGEPETCSHCNAELESAYGPVED